MAFPWALPQLCAKCGAVSISCTSSAAVKDPRIPLPSLTYCHDLMKEPWKIHYICFFLKQELLCHVHKYVVREYIVQIIKPKKKMNGEKRQQVSERIKQEVKILNNALIDHVRQLPPVIPWLSHTHRCNVLTWPLGTNIGGSQGREPC